jgi:hypothetical protein
MIPQSAKKAKNPAMFRSIALLFCIGALFY